MVNGAQSSQLVWFSALWAIWDSQASKGHGLLSRSFMPLRNGLKLATRTQEHHSEQGGWFMETQFKPVSSSVKCG